MLEWVFDNLGWWILPIWAIGSVPFGILVGKAMKWGWDDGEQGS